MSHERRYATRKQLKIIRRFHELPGVFELRDFPGTYEYLAGDICIRREEATFVAISPGNKTLCVSNWDDTPGLNVCHWTHWAEIVRDDVGLQRVVELLCELK